MHRGGFGRDTDNACGSVGRDTRYKSCVGRDTDNACGSVGRDTRYKSGVGRDTDNACGSVGRDTDNSNRAQCKGWIRSGNDGQELSSNSTAALPVK